MSDTQATVDSIIANYLSQLSKTILFEGQATMTETANSKVSKVIFGQKIANIVIAGPELRLIFKIHFTDELGKSFFQKVLKLANSTSQSVEDYFLESCNLLAGRIKQLLSDKNTNVGISIPIKTKGFDDLFFNLAAQNAFCTEWHWDLAVQELSIHCSLFVELLDINYKVEFEDVSETSTEDEVEFF
jgi:CheY-specific phosphatase CheX